MLGGMDDKRIFHIPAIVCQACIDVLRTILLENRAIKKVAFDFKNKQAEINCDDSMDDIEILKLITDAGYNTPLPQRVFVSSNKRKTREENLQNIQAIDEEKEDQELVSGRYIVAIPTAVTPKCLEALVSELERKLSLSCSYSPSSQDIFITTQQSIEMVNLYQAVAETGHRIGSIETNTSQPCTLFDENKNKKEKLEM